MKNVNVIQVVSKKAPIITIDPFTRAIYVRFSSNKVAKTIDDSDGGAIVNIDIDAKGDVVGVELVGVGKVSIAKMGRILSKRISNLPDLSKAEIESDAALSVWFHLRQKEIGGAGLPRRLWNQA